jgi:endonuclease YncB( thermonuclease family)
MECVSGLSSRTTARKSCTTAYGSRPDESVDYSVRLANRCLASALVALVAPLTVAGTANPRENATYRIDYITDGDTVALRNGQRVRLVQIDAPEVYFGTECYGRAASRVTERLLPAGARVGLYAEPATDRIDDYGRFLRYVVRVNDGVNVNIALVAVGAAAPYFYEGRRGEYASRLEILAKSAKAKHRGLWGACPHTPYDPYHGIETRH